MGVEYEIHAVAPDTLPPRADLESLIRSLTPFVGQTEHGFQFQGKPDAAGWPDVTIALATDHVYVCNHLGHQQVFHQVFGRMISNLAGHLPGQTVGVREL